MYSNAHTAAHVYKSLDVRVERQTSLLFAGPECYYADYDVTHLVWLAHA